MVVLFPHCRILSNSTTPLSKRSNTSQSSNRYACKHKSHENTYRCRPRGRCYKHFDHHFDDSNRKLAAPARLLCQGVTRTGTLTQACSSSASWEKNADCIATPHQSTWSPFVPHFSSWLALGYFGKAKPQGYWLVTVSIVEGLTPALRLITLEWPGDSPKKARDSNTPIRQGKAERGAQGEES